MEKTLNILLLATGYLTGTFVALIHETNLRFETLAFLLVNAAFSITLAAAIHNRSAPPIAKVVYAVFLFAYILRAPLTLASGLNTPTLSHSIGTIISHDSFRTALTTCTLAHIGTCILLFAFCTTNRKLYPIKGSIKNTHSLLILHLAFIASITTSYALNYFDIGVMGRENKELPFKLSGIIFYTRTIAIPLVVISIITNLKTKAFTTNFAILLLIVHALSETILRASRAPLFILALQLFYIYTTYQKHEGKRPLGIRPATIGSISIIALALWPFIDAYRVYKGHSIDSESAAALQSALTENEEIDLLFGVQRLANRIIGFPQVCGIIEKLPTKPLAWEISQSHSIGKYYTAEIVGINRIGHLSSPSLIGTSYLLGGKFAWPTIYILYFLLLYAQWRACFLFKNLHQPLQCFILYEGFNTIMAGTIDYSVSRFTLILFIALPIELGLRSLNRDSTQPTISAAE